MSNSDLHICLFADERSIHTRRWVLGLRGLGHKVDLITLMKNKSEDIGGISLNAGGKLSYLTKISALRRLVDRMKPDIFHSHHASSYGFLASFVNHPRKILSVWGYDVVDFPYRNIVNKAIIRRALKKADYLTATSHFLEKAVKKLYPVHGKIRVIPFGIDPEQFKYLDRAAKETINIGIAKTLRPKYGIDVLIRAFEILTDNHKNIRLTIAGGGEYAEEYKNLVEKKGLDDLIRFVGFVDHDKLPEFLLAIDIFAMPSIYDGESFGVAAVEASATGLPVVASRVGGVPEVVVDGRTGFLVDRKNAGELAKALEKLIVNPALRREMGKAGREYVENRYVWKDNLQAMNDLYLEAAG
jgi:glycosyltransferase involved in cell wall biosynthesis